MPKPTALTSKANVQPFRIGDTTVYIHHQGYANTGHIGTITFINVHEIEKTSIQAATAIRKRTGVRMLRLVSQGKRLISFRLKGRKYIFDPNRIFSNRGIWKTLRSNGSYSKAAHRAVKSFSDLLKRKYLKSASIIIAVHNNSGRLTVRHVSKRKDVAEVYINKKRDANDFFLVTNDHLFENLKYRGFNVVLSNLRNIADDGSLSVYCARNGIPYVNVEAQKGHFKQQFYMLAEIWLLSMLMWWRVEPKFDVPSYVNTGNYWARRKKYKRALVLYHWALQLSPKEAFAYINRGLVRYKLKQYRKALANYKKAERLNPNIAELYVNRGALYQKRKKYGKALADYNKAIKLKPKMAVTYNNRGMIWEMRKKYQMAFADYNKAIRLAPKDAKAYYNRGYLLNKLKQKRKAQADFKKACQLDASLCRK